MSKEKYPLQDWMQQTPETRNAQEEETLILGVVKGLREEINAHSQAKDALESLLQDQETMAFLGEHKLHVVLALLRQVLPKVKDQFEIIATDLEISMSESDRVGDILLRLHALFTEHAGNMDHIYNTLQKVQETHPGLTSFKELVAQHIGRLSFIEDQLRDLTLPIERARLRAELDHLLES